MVRWKILFSGQVQHVGFRYTAYYIARDLGLTGWVANLPDGQVLMEAQGEPVALRKLLLKLKDQRHIRITETRVTELPSLPKEYGFRVRHSAGTDF